MRDILYRKNSFLALFCLLAVFAVIVLMPNRETSAETTPGPEAVVETSLIDAGIDVTAVSVSESIVGIDYRQSVSEFNRTDEMLTKIATILATVSDQLGDSYQVKICQVFDDGQIMELVGLSEDGGPYLDGSLSSEAFMEKLEFNPQSRGPLLISGTCDPGKGDNCRNNPACECYPDEICDPESPEADEKGCVAKTAPPNAHLSGSQYVCDAGYEWNQDLTACVPETICPANAFKFQGECHCDEGYEWNEDMTQCVLSQASTGASDSDSDSSSSGCFISSVDIRSSVWQKISHFMRTYFFQILCF